MLTAKEDILLFLNRMKREAEFSAEEYANSIPEDSDLYRKLAMHSGERTFYMHLAIAAVENAMDVDLDNNPVS